MKVALCTILSILWLGSPVVYAEQVKLFHDQSEWKMMSEREKHIYVQGLMSGMVFGAKVTVFAGDDLGGAKYSEVVVYLDEFYEDTNNRNIAIPFALHILDHGVSGASKKSTERALRSYQGMTQMQAFKFLEGINFIFKARQKAKQKPGRRVTIIEE